MYSAATNLLQNHLTGTLSCLLSQSSGGALASSRPVALSAVRFPATHIPSNSKTYNSECEGKFVPCTDIPDVASILRAPATTLKNDASKTPADGTNYKSVVDEPLLGIVNKFLGSSSSSALTNIFGKKLSSTLQHFTVYDSQSAAFNNYVKGMIAYIHNHSKSRSRWYENHTSYDSFLQNKFLPKPQDLLRDCIANSYTNRLLNQLLLPGHPGLVISYRGFKTLRSKEREAAQNVSFRERLRGRGSQSGLSSEQHLDEFGSNPRLKSLLSESSSETSEKQVKMAFAEGYLAAEGGPKKKTTRTMRWVKTFQQVLTVIVLIVLLASLMSTMGGSLFRMHVTNGNEVQPEEITVSFEDVRGVEEAKQELEEIVEFLKCPEKFTSLGAELPKGVLLVGPPGTGKTLLARAVAGEAGVPFFHAAGPEFDEILVGQGARRVRDLFRAAKSRAPCVIFIDEIDSVGAKRTNSVLHPYANQTINQLLAEMDGFHKNEGVIVLGATNRRDDLDKALLRPGRFDVEVQVPIPDLAGRREIFDYYLSKVKFGTDVEVEVLARGTTGFTGADIKNVVNQAALRAAADLVDAVSMKHLESARDKVLMGPEKKSRIPDEEVNKVTAYHEGGHTLVAYYTKHSHPLHKVTIIPRGHSLGHTAYIPAKEQYNITRAQMLANLDSLMGGRAAEELIFGSEMITSGASSDLKQATSVATAMVKDFGMSDKVGLRTFEDNSGQLIGGGESLSVTTKEAIDAEIKRLLQESYERARTILRTHAKEHKALAEALLKYETLDADDIKAILDGKSVSKEI